MLGKVVVAVVACAALGGIARAEGFAVAEPVTYAGLLFGDAKCQDRFGVAGTAKGGDVKALKKCLEANIVHVQGDIWVVSGENSPRVVLTLAQVNGMVTAIAPMDAGKDDATLPALMEWVPVKKFKPSTRVADKMASATLATARVKICFDDKATLTSARITQSSGLVDYDRELLAYAKSLTATATTVGGKAIAACSISERDPNSKYDIVPPKELELRRTAGNPQIIPDDSTKVDIERSHKGKIVGSFKVCIDDKGAVSEVTMLKTTGFQAYDDKITNTIKSTWKYKPFGDDKGGTAPACSAVTFIYSQR